jgi:hypothetical protein
MFAYTRLNSLLPRRWALPISQAAMAAVMLTFWTLFRTRPAWADWVSVGFFVWGNLLGVLVISQFWTLANGIYDPRQAKRLFGFIGGGVMLGGMTGSGLTSFIIETVGANTLLLWSALTLVACMVLVSDPGQEKGAIQFPSRRHQGYRRHTEGAVSCAAVNSAIIAFDRLRRSAPRSSTSSSTWPRKAGGRQHRQFLAQIRSACRLPHLSSGVDHAAHPSLSGSGLRSGADLAVSATAILPDGVRGLRRCESRINLSHSVDKTTGRCCSATAVELRQEAKPLVDVTVDRMSRPRRHPSIDPDSAMGPASSGSELSFVSLGLTVLWCVNAFRAKRDTESVPRSPRAARRAAQG